MGGKKDWNSPLVVGSARRIVRREGRLDESNKGRMVRPENYLSILSKGSNINDNRKEGAQFENCRSWARTDKTRLYPPLWSSPSLGSVRCSASLVA